MYRARRVERDYRGVERAALRYQLVHDAHAEAAFYHRYSREVFYCGKYYARGYARLFEHRGDVFVAAQRGHDEVLFGAARERI